MIPLLILSKKRKGNLQQFVANNKDKAIVHLYCDKTMVDNADIVYLNPIKGEYGQKIVALTAGTHTFQGRFQATNIEAGKNVNFKSEKLTFDVPLEAGHTYTIAIYFYSPEERRNYYKGDVGIDVFSLPLAVQGGAVYNNAYVICYQED